MSYMLMKCAYCGADMGRKPCSPQNSGKTSHGICGKCEKKELKKIKEMK